MTTTDFDREIAAQDASAQRHLEELAYTIASLNEQLKPLEDQKKKAVDELKQLMALGELDEVTDGEHGVTARIQHRTTTVYDLVRLVETTEGCEALVDAARAGMVRVDGTMLTRFRRDSGAGWADLIDAKSMPGTGSDALVIERAK